MAITKIIYSAATYNMGEATERDGDNYRAWAFDMLADEYPDAEIEVVNEEMLHSKIWSDNENIAEAEKEEEQVREFLKSLWDKCPWVGKYFNEEIANDN